MVKADDLVKYFQYVNNHRTKPRVEKRHIATLACLDEKNRFFFEIRDDELYIGCRDSTRGVESEPRGTGHSRLVLDKRTQEGVLMPFIIIHRTKRSAIISILKHGIMAQGNREVVMFGLNEASTGRRDERDYTIYYLAREARERKGINFYITATGAVLTPDVCPPEHILFNSVQRMDCIH